MILSGDEFTNIREVEVSVKRRRKKGLGQRNKFLRY